MISRRQLLYFSALLFCCYPIANLKSLALANNKKKDQLYPLTIEILKEAYWAERIANRHYDEYCRKALLDNYPNIAYLFSALSISEKIHADNYQKLIFSLGSKIEKKEIRVSLAATKKNLNIAALRELEKINIFYPKVFKELSSESHDQAVLNCMYSWKSHQQHEKMINDIKKYSGFLFRLLAKKIENMNPNYFVCEICGSTIDEKPEQPCIICNYPDSHYKNLKRPV